ncbi:serine protease [Proteiniphilum sp.]|nr:serine protease [Proteiniphilum sp.]MEA4917445.1 serine protease [Proteiniphilum sp.]
MEFLQNAEPLLRIFWYIAAPVTVIFIIQTILTFVGGDSMDGVDADFEGDLSGGDAPFQLFSLRNLINFLLGYGWAGIAFYNLIPNKPILIIVAVIVGILFVAIFFMIVKVFLRLAEDNSFKMQDALHKTAEVYLTIPASRTGKGKILISVGGSLRELDAMTDEKESIHSRSTVKIIKIENNNILIVEKI